jgi:hypothetical protein
MFLFPPPIFLTYFQNSYLALKFIFRKCFSKKNYYSLWFRKDFWNIPLYTTTFTQLYFHLFFLTQSQGRRKNLRFFFVVFESTINIGVLTKIFYTHFVWWWYAFATPILWFVLGEIWVGEVGWRREKELIIFNVP